MTDINQSAELGPPLCIYTLQGTDRRMDGYPLPAVLHMDREGPAAI